MKRLFLALALLALTAVLYAQQPGFTRKMLQDHDVGVSDRHAVQVFVEFVPGGEGTLQLEIAGQPPRTLKAGETFFIPAGVVHDGRNTGTAPAKVLATYVVEKGKPVASPAQ
jgi:mannose-6-phosphate isomerase-like protein (cupin superfamily)